MAAIYGNGAPSHSHYVQSTSLTQYAGGLVSLALVAGVCVWGYQLIQRDVSEIPVVKAADSAMRVAPQNAGGEIAEHAGLSVNEVAGVGEAAGPSETLVVATPQQVLTQEDFDVGPMAEADEVTAADVAPQLGVEIAAPADTGLSSILPSELDAVATEVAAIEAAPTPTDVSAMVDALVGDTPAFAELAPVAEAAPLVIDASIPGVKVSLRPAVRPAAVVTLASAPVVDTPTAVSAALVEAAVPATAAANVVVQLGAFSSESVAAEEWSRLSGQFTSFMGDKTREIQQASSAGVTFYRLRTSGFADVAAARRFCETLKAGNAECTPLVLR